MCSLTYWRGRVAGEAILQNACRMCSLNIEGVPLLLQVKRFFKMREPEKMPEHMKRNQVSYTCMYTYSIRVCICIGMRVCRAHEA